MPVDLESLPLRLLVVICDALVCLLETFIQPTAQCMSGHCLMVGSLRVLPRQLHGVCSSFGATPLVYLLVCRTCMALIRARLHAYCAQLAPCCFTAITYRVKLFAHPTDSLVQIGNYCLVMILCFIVRCDVC